MLSAVYHSRFEKDVAKAKKRSKNMKKLRKVMLLLLEEKPLLANNCAHKLQSVYHDYWKCHIEPDWLFIYKKTPTEIIFVRTGAHADLFR
jgi:mRNA interferase YafQ